MTMRPPTAPLARLLLLSDRGAPLSRDVHRAMSPVSRDVPSSARRTRPTITGSPPFIVEWGIPGARDEVRAYVNRVDRLAVAVQRSYASWANERFAKGADATAPSVIELQFISEWPPWFARWKAWVAQTDRTFEGGPSPAEAWQRTEGYEQDVKRHRERLSAVVTECGADCDAKRIDLPKDPGPLEPAGGVDPKPSSIPWTPILAIAGVLAAGYVLSGIARVKGS